MQSIDVRPELTAENNPQTGELQDLERLTAQHGEALGSLASIILADREGAKKAVADLLSQVCREPLTTPAARSRRFLSRRLYLNCAWSRLTSGLRHGQSDEVSDAAVSKLGELSEQQRAAIALSLYGAHSYVQISELLKLDPAIVLNLMRSGLDELCRDSGPKARYVA